MNLTWYWNHSVCLPQLLLDQVLVGCTQDWAAALETSSAVLVRISATVKAMRIGRCMGGLLEAGRCPPAIPHPGEPQPTTVGTRERREIWPRLRPAAP